MYNYLKDETELCRMIGVVTKGTVLENITYRQIFSDFGHVCIFVLRTNNISTLEEKNIGLFLTHVATHHSLQLKRENVFKGQNEKVFHKFENFHIALAGLAMICKVNPKDFDLCLRGPLPGDCREVAGLFQRRA